jgi:N-acetylglutamate synthase-like GNAT family acetyltransferase
MDDRTLLIATDHGGVVGFATVIVLAEHAHLDQMAVHPAYGRRGHGTRLLEAACALARERGSTHITLTTFERIPWNAPYYAQRGFRVLAEDELNEALHERRELEATYGLDPKLRVVMRREVPPETLR